MISNEQLENLKSFISQLLMSEFEKISSQKLLQDELQILSVKEACYFLHISAPTLNIAIKHGQLKPFMVGRRKKFLKKDLVKFNNTHSK